MNKAALSPVTLVAALALQGCIITPPLPEPVPRIESGVAPRQVWPNITTRATLLEKGFPGLRTPDERFFLYESIVSRDWVSCIAMLTPVGISDSCGTVSTDYSARWVLVEFNNKDVVKREIIKDCENDVCVCTPAALLAMLEEHYSPALAAKYRPALDLVYALHQGLVRGDVQTIQEVLEKGADANAMVCGHIPLHLAIAQGNLAVVEVLLEAGADANARDAEGDMALHRAVAEGNTVLAALLLAGGADVNADDHNGAIPLLLASQDNSELVELLRAHGGRVSEERKRLWRLAGTWAGDGQRYDGASVSVRYVLKGNGAFVYDWLESYGSGTVEHPPGSLHVNGEKFEYEDAEGLLWTFTLDEDKNGRQILHVHSKEGTWTLQPCLEAEIACAVQP
jgi:hypothetical protein